MVKNTTRQIRMTQLNNPHQNFSFPPLERDFPYPLRLFGKHCLHKWMTDFDMKLPDPVYTDFQIIT